MPKQQSMASEGGKDPGHDVSQRSSRPAAEFQAEDGLTLTMAFARLSRGSGCLFSARGL